MARSSQTYENVEIFGLLQLTSDAILRVRQSQLREVGISNIQSALLYMVKHLEPPVTPAEISRRLFRKPHTVFALLKQMERQGLVRKIKDLERKNMARVVLTEKGEEAYRRSMEKWEAIDEIMSCLTREEHAALRSFLRQLRGKSLEKLGVHHRPVPRST